MHRTLLLGGPDLPCPEDRHLRALLLFLFFFFFFWGKVRPPACFLKLGTGKRTWDREPRFLVRFSYYRYPGVAWLKYI